MIKKNKKNKMTLDKLAIIVSNSFGGFEKRLNEKIEKMAIKDDIKDMATKSDIEELKTKIEKIDKRIDDFATIKVGYDKFNPLVKRVEKLEARS